MNSHRPVSVNNVKSLSRRHVEVVYSGNWLRAMSTVYPACNEVVQSGTWYTATSTQSIRHAESRPERDLVQSNVNRVCPTCNEVVQSGTWYRATSTVYPTCRESSRAGSGTQQCQQSLSDMQRVVQSGIWYTATSTVYLTCRESSRAETDTEQRQQSLSDMQRVVQSGIWYTAKSTESIRHAMRSSRAGPGTQQRCV